MIVQCNQHIVAAPSVSTMLDDDVLASSQCCLASVNSVFCWVNLMNICRFSAHLMWTEYRVLLVQTFPFNSPSVSIEEQYSYCVCTWLKHIFLGLVVKKCEFFAQNQNYRHKAVNLHFKGLPQLSLTSFDFRFLLLLIRHAIPNKHNTL